MLNAIIRFSLRHQPLVMAAALLALLYGTWQVLRLPIDVFPDLNRPRVVIMTEAPGMAPEEIETLISLPLETSINGASGVQAVRSSSTVGLSVILIEFNWDTDIHIARQIVNERLAVAIGQLPPGIQPQLAPISSIMGQIQIIGMYSETGSTSPMELRTLADWQVGQRLRAIPGVAQVITMGGQHKQFQVLVNPYELQRFGVSLHEVKLALQESNQNAAGGYLDEQGPYELLVRSLGRVNSVEELNRIVVRHRDGQSLHLSQLARVVEGRAVERGDGSAFVRTSDGTFTGGPAVVLTINKQPDADTRRVTQAVQNALDDIRPSLPSDVRLLPQLYRQETFIDLAISNVVEALRDGSILVVIILFAVLVNLRVTFITLTAIPLSIAVTAIVFQLLGLTINIMTLGGLAVAIGELVDDAIVDVENIYRRLQENRLAEHPKSKLQVVYDASCEIRNSIVFGTVIVALVFLPLFGLQGMEGRLFAPLAVAYIVSIFASLVVSLTVTPVLSHLLLSGSPSRRSAGDGLLLRLLKRGAGWAIAFSLRWSGPVMLLALTGTLFASWALWQLDRDFLPPFNEGSVQVNVLLPPGTSLATSNAVARKVEQQLQEIDAIESFVRKTGRAELDEHVEDVNVTAVIATLRPEIDRPRAEIIQEISDSVEEIPGVITSVEQPLAHLISHMLSGVTSQIAIKLYGDDLQVLRHEAEKIKNAIAGVNGVRDLYVEQQANIPQLRIEADDHRLSSYGLRRAQINELVQTAMQGQVVSQVLQGQRSFDLLVKLDEPYREDLHALRRLAIQLPDGGMAKLEDVARVYLSSGPNVINREQVRRRIVVQCNVTGRGLVDVVEDIRQRVAPIQAKLPENYFVEYSGQFENQQAASRVLAVLFGLSLVGVFLVLYTMFGSANLALQVLVAVPMAFIGSVAALYVTGQAMTVASMVGFISLCGIASRNGILLVNHYLHLVQHEGESWTRSMIVRAGKDRLAPVMMTALTSGIALIPLAMAAGEPGKEILFPVATVIIGGLISSTILEFLVRPALFWRFGIGSAKRVVQRPAASLVLSDESAGSTGPETAAHAH